jgi:murein DD-endopeptidase MepM/ murein hydrolase activator NlpD
MCANKMTVFFGLFLILALPALGDEIEKESERFKDSTVDAEPQKTASEWYLPFATKNRKSTKTVKVISTFGAGRRSYKKGHIHTGIDLVPRKKTSPKPDVYPLASGVVCSIHLAKPHITVVVKHKLPNGATLYSSYKHLAEVYTQTGKQVTHETKLGRLFTRKEAKEQGGNYDHLHLEVRKLFDDHGVASFLTMTKADLNKRFENPWSFLKKQLNPPQGMYPKQATRFLTAARELLGVGYEFGGRLRKSGEGIDCQGIIFYAAERIGRCRWKSFSTMPTDSVAWKELGVRVPGLDPVRTQSLDTSYLKPGDIILLVDKVENTAEKSIAQIDDTPVWVWHTAIYTQDGNFIHADAFSGKVVEEDLQGFLEEHGFAGIFVTRMTKGPKPKRCRRNQRMALSVPVVSTP